MDESKHKCGFVNILGKPNAGKSTLVNALVGENVAIVSPKEQTTRHRIFGIENTPDYQVIYSDTPGILSPKYELQDRMLKFAISALNDADLFLWVIDARDREIDKALLGKMKKREAPIVLIINKIDLVSKEDIDDLIQFWKKETEISSVVTISALRDKNFLALKSNILLHIPYHVPLFPKDVVTDKTERFYVSEIIRKHILKNYSEEIPYCSEVSVESFVEEPNIIKIKTVIYVERETQKKIIIGKNASAIKKISTKARLELEDFFAKKIFLEQYVKVSKDWRSDINKLDSFGY